jgi:hypothetical protein
VHEGLIPEIYVLCLKGVFFLVASSLFILLARDLTPEVDL